MFTSPVGFYSEKMDYDLSDAMSEFEKSIDEHLKIYDTVGVPPLVIDINQLFRVRTEPRSEVMKTRVGPSDPVDLRNPYLVQQDDVSVQISEYMKLLAYAKKREGIVADTVVDCRNGGYYDPKQVSVIGVAPRPSDVRYINCGTTVRFSHNGSMFEYTPIKDAQVLECDLIPLGEGMNGYGIFNVWCLSVPRATKDKPVCITSYDHNQPVIPSRLMFSENVEDQIMVPQGTYLDAACIMEGYISYYYRGKSYRIAGPYKLGDTAVLVNNGVLSMCAFTIPGVDMISSMIWLQTRTRRKVFCSGPVHLAQFSGLYYIQKPFERFPDPIDTAVDGKYGSITDPIYKVYLSIGYKWSTWHEIEMLDKGYADYMSAHGIVQDVSHFVEGCLVSRSFALNPKIAQKLGLTSRNIEVHNVPSPVRIDVQGLICVGLRFDHEFFQKCGYAPKTIAKIARKLVVGLPHVGIEKVEDSARVVIKGSIMDLAHRQFAMNYNTGRLILGKDSCMMRVSDFIEKGKEKFYNRADYNDLEWSIPVMHAIELVAKGPITVRDACEYSRLGSRWFELMQANNMIKIYEYENDKLIVPIGYDPTFNMKVG